MKKHKYEILLFLLILLVAFVLRFYKLGFIPNGLQQDESSIGYNAFSILKTGRDEHGVYFPQNFKAFGEYKLPGYIYASVIPIELFGFTPFSIRFVSAMSGFLSIFVVFFLIKKLLKIQANTLFQKQEYLPYIIAFLLAINPWHLQFSRAAFEVMLANFFILCGVWLLLIGLMKSKFLYFLFAILLLSASLYTYNIARLFTPILALILIIIFRRKIWSLPRSFFLGIVFISILCLVPFVLGALMHGGTDSTFGTLIFSSAKVQAPLQEFRSYFVDLPLPIDKLILNYWTLTFWQYINNIFAHLSVAFYFIGGSDGITSVGTTGYWYLFELPFIIWGIVSLSKTKSLLGKIIFSWIISLILVTSLTREPPQATRTFFLIFPITFLSGLGILRFAQYIKSLSQKTIKFSLLFGVLAIACFYVVMYFISYYVRFPIYYAKNWRVGDREVALYIKDHQNDFDRIIFDESAGFMYTSLLTYLDYSPNLFQHETIWSKEDSEGFSHPVRFGKYEFRTVDWTKDMSMPRTLIITTVDKKPSEVAPLKAIYYPMRPVVFNVGQEIMRYPVEEIAYVLVGTDNANRFKK